MHCISGLSLRTNDAVICSIQWCNPDRNCRKNVYTTYDTFKLIAAASVSSHYTPVILHVIYIDFFMHNKLRFVPETLNISMFHISNLFLQLFYIWYVYKWAIVPALMFILIYNLIMYIYIQLRSIAVVFLTVCVWVRVCICICVCVCKLPFKHTRSIAVVFLTVCLCLCLCLCVCVYVSVCLSVCLSACLSVCMSVWGQGWLQLTSDWSNCWEFYIKS